MAVDPPAADSRQGAARGILGPQQAPLAASLLSLYAGALHLSVVPEHLQAWWGFGVFFLAAGIAQVAFGLLVLRRPGTLTAIAGIAGNLVLAGLYLASRTNGVPVGPVHAGHRLEPAGVLDLTTTAAELVLIALLVSLLPPRIARITVNVLLVAGLGLWVLRFSGLLA